jgi:signal transduction histidine kinase
MRVARPRRPRPTARLRLTILYGCVCLVFGAILLAFIYSLTWGALTTTLTAHAHPRGNSSQSSSAQQAPQGQAPDVAEQVNFDRGLLLTRSAIALGLVSMAAVGAGWLLAGRVLRPLSTISTTAQRISASSLHERLALEGPDDELKELGDTLDALLARLEDSFDAQRRFAANASHELRTPLTRERTLLQVTLSDPASTLDTWQAVSRELLASNSEQERLIEGMLTLASSEAGLGQRESIDLAAIATTAIVDPRPGIGRLDLSVRGEIRPAALEGDPLLIQQLVTNLIDNAVRHNVPGGDVLVGTGTSGGRAVLSVSNTGPFIPPAEVDRLLQPFQRLGPRQARRDGGHGLGLSIVRAITIAHGAAITVRPRPDGGLAIDVAFPSLPLYRPNSRRADAGPAVRPSALSRVMRGTGFAHFSQPRDEE